VAVSEGIALGPFHRYQPPVPPISDERVSDPALAWAGLEKAIASTRKAIGQRRSTLEKNLGERDAYSTAIFEAHELILQDPDLLEATRFSIFNDCLNSAAAWDQAVKRIAASYRSLDDPYLKQRAIDVVDVGNQVLFALAGKPEGLKIELPGPVILFAEELTPTETSSLDMNQVLGLMTVGGGPTSHSAILARALSIPAVSGVSAALESLEPGTLVGLDGFSGQLWVAPDAGQQGELSARRAAWLEERERLLRTSQELAATADGQRVEVVANVGSVQDAQKAAENGAEGIGLLRTEFLFLTRSTPPSEEEQYDELCQIGLAMTQAGQHDWPMIVRTLDVGGDKELPFVQLAPEANPFLGVRALRLSLRKPELFQPQLRAILRAGVNYRFRVMFPMVANLNEVLQARQALEQAHAGLLETGLPHRWPVEMGIMVEIPSAALLSRTIAPQVDFFSIGTNDLTQYTLAAERGNPLLSGLADALHPAVLRLIGEVAQSAHQYGKFTGVCGELAGDPLAVPVLVGLGVDELSMNPGAAPRAKAIVRLLKMEQARSLAAEVLAAPGAPEVRQIARAFFQTQIEPNLK
jgi:phosphoenolpyruvate-protein phosphotransferase